MACGTTNGCVEPQTDSGTTPFLKRAFGTFCKRLVEPQTVCGTALKFAIKNVMDAKISEVSQGPSVLPAAAIPNDLPLAGRSMYAELQLDY